MRFLQALLLAATFFTPAKAEQYLGLGVDVVHEQYRPALSYRYDSLIVMGWEGNLAVGASYDLKGTHWQAGLGLIGLVNTERRAGTHENFLVVIRYCDDWCVSLNHVSHASGSWIGYKKDKPNGGLNWLSLEFPL